MKALKMPEFNIFYKAPVLILMFAMPDTHTSHEYDCAAAAENMLIAARSLGIGSCWIGLGMPLGSDQNTLAELDVPEGYRLMMPLIFGYPVKDVETPPPRDADVIFKWVP
jgi:nitroreductase